MFKKTLTLSALVLAANSYAGEAEVRAHVQEVVGHLQAIETAGINNPKTVGPDGCDFTTIQEAIDSGADQVRIVAKDSPYFENVIIQNKQVALKGNYADCADAGNDVESDVKAIIDGDKKGPVIKYSMTDGDYRNHVSHIVIQHGDLSYGGGGIAVTEGYNSFYWIDNVTVSNNTGRNGGIGTKGLTYVLDSVIENNIANGNSPNGGGIFSLAGSIMIDGNTKIRNNESNSAGGGFHIHASEEEKVTIFSPTVFENNKAKTEGGAMRVRATFNMYGKRFCEQGYCFGTNQPVKIIGNQAGNGSFEGKGGGVYISSQLKNSVFNVIHVGNQASEGGAYFTREGSSVKVYRSHFEQNSADVGAIAASVGINSVLYDSTEFQVHDSVIINNGNGGYEEYTDGFLFYADINAKLSLNYNTIAGNDVTGPLIYNTGDEVTTFVVSSIIDEDNDLYFGINGAYLDPECLLLKNLGGITLPAPADIQIGDAQFVDAANGDYLLTAGSPAIDFCGQLAEGNFDKDGNPRGFDDIKTNKFGTYDLGAYEYMGSDIIFEDGFE